MNKRIANIFTRELHLVDIENELGTGTPSARDISRFRDFYIATNEVPRDAHIVIAASSKETLLEAAFGWPHARTVFLEGRDGADRALIEVALEENVEKRYGKVVFGSGDHIFVDAAIALQGLGVVVKFFARAIHVSRFIRECCDDVKLFSAADFSLAA
jgi:hypothetical protein